MTIDPTGSIPLRDIDLSITRDGSRFFFRNYNGTIGYVNVAQEGVLGSDGSPTITTAAQLTADADNYAIAEQNILRISSDAPRAITGIVAGHDGEAKLVINVGQHDITLKHASESSSVGNRFSVPWSGDYTMMFNGGAALLIYDADAGVWRTI